MDFNNAGKTLFKMLGVKHRIMDRSSFTTMSRPITTKNNLDRNHLIESRKKNLFRFLLNRLKWLRVPITFTFTLVMVGHLVRYQRNKNNRNDLDPYRPLPLEVSIYKLLPLRTISRFWGWINSIELPYPVRIPILKSYAKAFGCDLNEAFIQDLNEYKNLSEFFRRELKPGLRPIAGCPDDIVSPCDGSVLNVGSAQNGLLEQVKGINYTIESFLGPNTWNEFSKINSDGEDYQKSLLQNSDTDLYHCVIYLAPGDYHRFHSPANWTIRFRRHFPGKLYSVRPTFASWFPNLFSVNERVVYIGDWKFGFFAMIPVGATNVGSMRIYFDEKLKTNQTKFLLSNVFDDQSLENINLKKGDPFGEFNLGSTIVLLFEAPKNLQFKTSTSSKIKYGQLLGILN
ncbi:phosphatidylserine decarboxylase proenzyme-like [Sarcoptes scabiei]|nr:phosphatidylserine decarboxylase proenzyme-like [Sarcoptes scabiei]